jgi:hypothetical protein
MRIAPQILLVIMLLSLSFTKVIAEMPAMAPLFVDNKQNQPMWDPLRNLEPPK